MKSARLIFHGELADFLKGDCLIDHRFWGEPAIKDVIEALGVPHVEVGRVLINDIEVSWDARLKEGNDVKVFDVISIPSSNLRPALPAEIRFVLDGHLGRLAAYLRLLGFDTHWHQHAHDPDLAEISAHENRVLLTRDIGLLKRNQVVHGRWVRNTDPQKQMMEVLEHWSALKGQIRSFTRCMSCNGLVAPVAKDAVLHLLLPETRKHYEEFFQCENCKKVYWKGPHFEKMTGLISQLLPDEPPGGRQRA